ncbi:hypothetical protein P152DRAFT_106037 [Eremomyces bilateralis CBS 781.70]|uniref:Uncharacterized protein n=1 Tax=Eremomyces bilateralis CBS 781.70 TaxID=1392243 RepID=A0A6G1FWP5_9PEZI|nr:uncharacterized protein P152DRAFT_106037 [Eremomyces bilateralis CBS 781.70]KAF1810257.1 hypothetical protein P152DRAFT_106037 [Eremomyces bilateralis CBS 781.70]
MEWGPDFCLVCDKQTTGSAYCSQACRLADETSGLLPQASPSNLPQYTGSRSSTSSHSASSSTSSSTSSTHGFHLPPPLNFSALRRPSYDATPSFQSRPSTTTSPSSSSRTTSTRPHLSTSSSRSSLSSLSSSSTAPSSTQAYGLSESTMHQLRDYVSAFDQTRDMKRKFTVQ